MQRLVFYLLVFGMLIGTGIAHGVITDRWSGSADPHAQAAAYARIPTTIEDWDGSPVETVKAYLPPELVQDSLLRRYVNRVDGSVVIVYLRGGRPGPIVAEHSPDSCYPGAGYEFLAPPARRSILAGPSARPQQFWVANFSKTERAEPVYGRIFWSWSGSGTWETPDYPRLAFAHFRKLYKVYVVRQLLKAAEPLEDNDPAIRFIQVLVPELEKALFAGS
jgi:Protein of unknown function (DUF3485)